MTENPANNPDYELLFQFFGYQHLPEKMQPTSKLFHDLAVRIITTMPQNPERTVALRKLLEAKDCAVRSTIFKWPPKPEAEGSRS